MERATKSYKGRIEMRQSRLLPALPVISESAENTTCTASSCGGFFPRLDTDGDRDGKRSNDGPSHIHQDSVTHRCDSREQNRYTQTHQDQVALIRESTLQYLYPRTSATSRKASATTTATTHSTLRAALDLESPRPLPIDAAPRYRAGKLSPQLEIAEREKPLPPAPTVAIASATPLRNAFTAPTCETAVISGYKSHPKARHSDSVPQQIEQEQTRKQYATTSTSRFACPQLVISDYDLDRASASETETDSAASTPLQTPVLPDSEHFADTVRIALPPSHPYYSYGYERSRHGPRDSNGSGDSDDSNGSHDSNDSNDSDNFAVIRYVKDPAALRQRLAQSQALAIARERQRQEEYSDPFVSAAAASTAPHDSGPNGRRVTVKGVIERPGAVLRESP